MSWLWVNVAKYSATPWPCSRPDWAFNLMVLTLALILALSNNIFSSLSKVSNLMMWLKAIKLEHMSHKDEMGVQCKSCSCPSRSSSNTWLTNSAKLGLSDLGMAFNDAPGLNLPIMALCTVRVTLQHSHYGWAGLSLTCPTFRESWSELDSLSCPCKPRRACRGKISRKKDLLVRYVR